MSSRDHHQAADLPADLLALLNGYLLDLGGTYGDPNAGDPIQYAELHIEHDQGVTEIVVYNRAGKQRSTNVRCTLCGYRWTTRRSPTVSV